MLTTTKVFGESQRYQTAKVTVEKPKTEKITLDAFWDFVNADQETYRKKLAEIKRMLTEAEQERQQLLEEARRIRLADEQLWLDAEVLQKRVDCYREKMELIDRHSMILKKRLA